MIARAWIVLLACLLAVASSAQAQTYKSISDLPSPDGVRSAIGSPGPGYWQQKVSYKIDAALDETSQTITATARITYTNNAPIALGALWFAKDETTYDAESLAYTAQPLEPGPGGGAVMPVWRMTWDHAKQSAKAGLNISAARTSKGKALTLQENQNFVRVVLPRPLEPGKRIQFSLDWTIKLGDFGNIFSRGGYEYFRKTNSYQFSVGHWFPRALTFAPGEGWRFDAFLGEGEFSGEFGDYDVSLDVPASHIVAATGLLSNARDVLTPLHRERLNAARTSAAAIAIITPDEAKANDAAGKTQARKIWRFKADNVRDFAWASSPKFAWDAADYAQDGSDQAHVLVQSLYPYEAAGLWHKTSTKLVQHTLRVYGRMTIPYPYPAMTSVNAYSFLTGVEYPMMGFTGPRPFYDYNSGLAQYSRMHKDGMAELVIHETGHSYFPMIVSSDERRFGWMDEGLNTLLNHIAVMEWDDAPGLLFGAPLEGSFRRTVSKTAAAPIMAKPDDNPEAFATNYFKAVGALILLREHVLGRESFDRALKTYAQRWRFKQVTPADFFRTVGAVSGHDLDWFWNGWFFSTAYFDMGLSNVVRFNDEPFQRPKRAPAAQPSTKGPPKAPPPAPLTRRGNDAAGVPSDAAKAAGLIDFYSGAKPEQSAPTIMGGFEPLRYNDEAFAAASAAWPFRYGVSVKNTGGLLMPLTLRLHFSDDTYEDRTLPVQLWRYNAGETTAAVYSEKAVVKFELDPDNRLPDANMSDNVLQGPFSEKSMFPARPQRSPTGEMSAAGVAVTPDGTLLKLPPSE